MKSRCLAVGLEVKGEMLESIGLLLLEEPQWLARLVQDSLGVFRFGLVGE